MKMKSNGTSLFRRSYAEAGETLGKRGTRFLLMQGWIVSLLLVPIYVLLGNAFALLSALLETQYGVPFGVMAQSLSSLLEISITVFVSLPLLLGVVRLGDRAALGEDPVLAEVFASFSSPSEYKRALTLSFDLYWRLWLILELPYLIHLAAFAVIPVDFLAWICTILLSALSAAAGVYLCLRRFFALFFALRPSGNAEKGRMPRSLGARFWFSCLPHILLGLLTVGVWLLYEVLPRISIAYFQYCNHTIEDLTQTEEK